ncbi:hypothetical protein DFH08DRAFT_59801 [Mycena albidolilacea]|uniref:Uncharacterized protein n=1 Tax=Mycena albidolilacea TaxID=1033008 RepID=A0AAD7A9U9_9AGAR|nr:hypothetical protein DFH08DRAFT_59801 [Mycena albidolilacea]
MPLCMYRITYQDGNIGNGSRRHLSTHIENFADRVRTRARRYPVDVYQFTRRSDPATLRFESKLREHLLGRLLNRDFDGDTHETFTEDDLGTVRILNNKIYSTKTLHVNHTTYDVLRDQDSFNPRTGAFVMVNSFETTPGAHPYWYCQLLGVFHARVYRVLDGEATEAEEMSFLWVRWLGEEPGYRPSMKAGRLPKVSFVPESDGYAFGFLDPAHVIRGSHPIPDFESGQTNDLLATREVTLARLLTDSSDWTSFFVDIFVDRDMLMRYFGGAIGHKNSFVEDEDLFPPPDSAAGPNTSADSSNGETDPDALDGDPGDDQSSEEDSSDRDNDSSKESDEGDPEKEEYFGPEDELEDDLGFAES